MSASSIVSTVALSSGFSIFHASAEVNHFPFHSLEERLKETSTSSPSFKFEIRLIFSSPNNLKQISGLYCAPVFKTKDCDFHSFPALLTPSSISSLCLISTHISRISDELIMWSTQRFNFVTMSENFTTGSSIMPQKRNPDAAELARGKSSRLVGNLINLISIIKGLPLAYSKDLQEDKEPVFDSAETIKMCLEKLNITSFKQ